MSNIQTGAERMPHDLSHLGFLAGQIGRLITISTTPVIAGDSFEMDAVGALRLSPLRRGLAIDSTVDIFTFYVPHRHVYGEQWIKFMKDGVNATPLPTVNTTGYIDHAAFLGTINPDTNKIPKHLFQGYLNIYNNYFKAPWMPDRTEANPNELNQDDARYIVHAGYVGAGDAYTNKTPKRLLQGYSGLDVNLVNVAVSAGSALAMLSEGTQHHAHYGRGRCRLEGVLSAARRSGTDRWR